MSVTYRYRCTSENDFIYEDRLVTDPAPSVCKNDGGHTIITESITIVAMDDYKTAPPTVTDDVSKDYRIGSRWVDKTTGDEYVCVDNATGAAEWILTTITDHDDLTSKGSNSHAAIDAHLADASLHRVINDTGTSATELWSASKIDAELTAITNQKGAVNGIATLDGTGKVPTSQLPALALTDVTVVADIAARDALTPDTGDVAKVNDSDGLGHPQTYIYDGSVWVSIQESSDVISVNGQTGTVILNTGHVSEGSNLYYTTARFDTRLATKTTDNLTEGSNLYYTTARFDTRLATKTTDNLAEGSTNKYFTDARVTAATAVAANTAHRIDTNNPHGVTIDQITPSTTKGDLLVEDGSNVVRVAVGTNKQVLNAASGQASGVEWSNPRLLSFSWGSDSGPYREEIGTASWSQMQTFIFPGSLVAGTPTKIELVTGASAANKLRWRIWDVENSKKIAESTGKGHMYLTRFDIGALSNIPTGSSMFEIQWQERNSSDTAAEGHNTNARLAACTISFA